MDGTLTARAQKGEGLVLLPGSTAAEPWEAWTTGAHARCLQVCQKPDENSGRRGAVLALPVTQVVALPLWLQETDARLFRGMIALQLEARALQPRGREAVFDWSVVAQEETQTLVLVGIVAATLPEELETDVWPAFDLAVRCFTLPSDAMIIWREQDRLAVAITRHDRLAYFQALPESELTARVLQDLTCIVAALQMQRVIEELRQAVLWTDVSPEEADNLEAHLALPVRQEERPAPALPAQAWSLTPARVGEVKRHRLARRWQGRAIAMLVLLVVGVACVLGLRLFLTAHAVSRLQQWQAAHAATLEMVHDTQGAWQALQPVVDTAHYPLEVLLHVTESLPEDQVHLTLFETEGHHLLIKAEAKNLTAAFQFFDQLKKNPHLSGYAWEMAQPHSLANDITQLQIEGTHAASN